MPSNALSSTAIAVLNHLLEPATWARERLMEYAGSNICLRTGSSDILFSITENGRVSHAGGRVAPAVTITVPLQSLPGMLSSGSKTLPANIRIEGSAEMADAVGFVLRNLRWDAEEDLSRVIGDIPAHRVTLVAQSLRTTAIQAFGALAGNISERLDEEGAPLLGRFVHDAFAVEVRALRDTVARLDKRVERYAGRRPKHP